MTKEQMKYENTKMHWLDKLTGRDRVAELEEKVNRECDALAFQINQLENKHEAILINANKKNQILQNTIEKLEEKVISMGSKIANLQKQSKHARKNND